MLEVTQLVRGRAQITLGLLDSKVVLLSILNKDRDRKANTELTAAL